MMEALVSTLGVAAVVTVVVIAVQALLWKRRYRDQSEGRKPLPPGSMGWPFVGETLKMVSMGTQFFDTKFAQYGNIFKTHVLGSPLVRVTGADRIRALMGREPQGLDVKWPTSVRKLMGPQSLSLVYGKQHARLRKIAQTVFQPTRLSDYLPTVQEHVRSNLQAWCQRGQVLGSEVCEDLVTDTMIEVLLGLRKDKDIGRRVREAVFTIHRNLLFTLSYEFPGGGLKKGMAARQVVRDFIQSRIDGRHDKDHVSMLDIFLSRHGTPDGMDDQELMDNAVALLIAANGTTSAALALSIMALGQHPEVVRTLRQELDDVGLLDKDIDQTLTYDLLQKLTFVQCVEREVLRLYMPVGGVYRQAHMDIETEDYLIPKDWTVVYSIRNTHQTTEAFQERERFIPERWLEPETQKQLGQDACHYMPFGVGPRVCVGRQLARMVIHVFLVELVRLVDWRLVNPRPDIVHMPTTMAKDRLPVVFTARP